MEGRPEARNAPERWPGHQAGEAKEGGGTAEMGRAMCFGRGGRGGWGEDVVRRRLECVWTRWFLFLPERPRSKSRWRPLLAAGGGRQRIKESGYTRFESGAPLQTGWKTRSMGTQNGGRTFVKAATNARDVKRGRFDPVHHLWFGSSQRPRRGRNPWVVFRGVIWGVAVRYIVSIGLERAFIRHMSPGARL